MPSRRRVAWVASILIAATPPSAYAAPDGLPALAARGDEVTVSGVSSGGYMAVQYHLAHSETVSGAGVLAAGPYGCADGSAWHALTRCMAPRSWSPLPSDDVIRQRIERRADAGAIDPLSGLAGDRAWIFSGGQDRTVERPVVEALVAAYRHWLPGEALRFETWGDAGHAMISIAAPESAACARSEPPYINRCGEFDAAGELLKHLIGPLAPRQAPQADRLRRFDQVPFLGADPAASGMADSGYLFVPPDCEAGGCRIHVAFHGCRQSDAQVGDRFARTAGYLEWAQGNRLVVLFPQVSPAFGWRGGLSWIFNPRGCWDWWGYTGADYDRRAGRQIRAVSAMVAQLAAPVPRSR